VQTRSDILDIESRYDCPKIFLATGPLIDDSEFPSGAIRLMRPYDESILRSVISEALLIGFDRDSLVDETQSDRLDEPNDHAEIDPVEVDVAQLEEALSTGPSPVESEFIGGQLRLAETTPLAETLIPMAALEALKEDHSRDVLRVLTIASNVGPSFNARLEALSKLLEDELTEQSILRIGNQVEALRLMRAAVDEALGPQSAGDVKALIDALRKFTRQFRLWRQFSDEASTIATLSDDERGALRDVARALYAQPSEVVSEPLKEAIKETEAAQRDVPNPASDLAFAQAIASPFRAIGRYLVARAKGAGTQFNASLEKNIGEGLAGGVVTLLIAASTPLLALAVQMPSHFAWVGPILAALRVTLKR
jgi:hypothetical protein